MGADALPSDLLCRVAAWAGPVAEAALRATCRGWRLGLRGRTLVVRLSDSGLPAVGVSPDALVFHVADVPCLRDHGGPRLYVGLETLLCNGRGPPHLRCHPTTLMVLGPGVRPESVSVNALVDVLADHLTDPRQRVVSLVLRLRHLADAAPETARNLVNALASSATLQHLTLCTLLGKQHAYPWLVHLVRHAAVHWTSLRLELPPRAEPWLVLALAGLPDDVVRLRHLTLMLRMPIVSRKNVFHSLTRHVWVSLRTLCIVLARDTLTLLGAVLAGPTPSEPVAWPRLRSLHLNLDCTGVPAEGVARLCSVVWHHAPQLTRVTLRAEHNGLGSALWLHLTPLLVRVQRATLYLGGNHCGPPPRHLPNVRVRDR